MHYTYASLLLAGILAVGAGQPVMAQVSAPVQTARVSPVADYLTPPNAVTLECQFSVVDNNPVIKGSILLPTHTEGNWWEDIPSQEITTPLTRLLVVRYEPNNPDGPKTIIMEKTNVMPGATLSFVDTEISAGETWEYAANVWLGDQVSTNEWGQGTSTVLAGFRPKDISDMVGEAASITGPITLTFSAPDGVDEECDIPFVPASVWITRTFAPRDTEEGDDDDIDFAPSREPVVIWRTDNATAGQAFTVVDDNDGKPMPKGVYTYTGYTSWQWGESMPYNAVTIGLFEDAPDSPTNVRATLTDEGALITWKPSTKGQGYPAGYVDPATLRYDVYRYEDYSLTKLIAENIAETEVIDPLDDITTLQTMSWRVIAHNDLGTSAYGGITPAIAVGPAIEMPFVETFSKYDYDYAADNIWSVEQIDDTDLQWYVGELAYGENPKGEWLNFYPQGYPNANHGMAYVSVSQYATPGTTGYTTSRMDFSKYATGQLTFSYFTHPDASGKLAIDLTFFGSREPMTLWEGSLRGEEEGWKQETVSFSGLDDVDMMQLRLLATLEKSTTNWYIPIMVDYIKLEGVDYVGVDTLPVDQNATTEYFNLQGMRISNPAKGQIVIRRATGADGRTSTTKVIY